MHARIGWGRKFQIRGARFEKQTVWLEAKFEAWKSYIQTGSFCLRAYQKQMFWHNFENVLNNPHMRKPGWRWKWAGRASLEDRPRLLVTGGCWLMRRKVTGRMPSCWQCACRGRIRRLPRPYGACPRPHRALAQAIGRLPQAASGACPWPHRGAPGIYLRCVDWAHSQSLWPGAFPGRTGRTPGIYAIYATGRTPSPTLLGFKLYAISGRAHFRHRPMQLRAIHRGWAHSQAFGGNVSAFNANATSQASTRFAQLVWPHGYCWYPPARFNLFPANVPTREHTFGVLFPQVGKTKTQVFFKKGVV